MFAKLSRPINSEGEGMSSQCHRLHYLLHYALFLRALHCVALFKYHQIKLLSGYVMIRLILYVRRTQLEAVHDEGCPK